MSIFQPVVTERASKSQRIVTQIQQLVVDGELKPGEKLPPERDLAVIFNVSRTSVREAIKTLAALDLLDIRKGLGVFVKEAMLDTFFTSIADTLVISQAEAHMLFEVRKVLETQAASWAAMRATDEEIEELKALVKEARALGNKKIDAELAREYDKKFHTAIIRLSHNEVLSKIITGMFDVLDRIRQKTAILPGRAVQSISDHGAIARAVADRDPEKARKVMYNHIEGVGKTLSVNDYKIISRKKV